MRLFALLMLATLLFTPTVVAGGPPPAFRDCNSDGYEGITFLQVNPYPSWILLDDTLCPVGSAWNNGQWVTEF